MASAVSAEAAWVVFSNIGELGRNGPSRMLAGESGLLPGIVSKPDRVGGDECTAARISRCTEDVSQESKALSIETASPAGNAGLSNEDRAEPLTSFVFEEDAGATRVAEDRPAVDGVRDVGVRGGECNVASCD